MSILNFETQGFATIIMGGLWAITHVAHFYLKFSISRILEVCMWAHVCAHEIISNYVVSFIDHISHDITKCNHG